MQVKPRLILLILFLICGINSFSQSLDSLWIYNLNDVIVTASRNKKLLKKTPEVMHVITSSEIEQLNVSSTGEILEYLTGVNIESGTGSGYPKRSIVSLDGFPANYSLVMVDGIRLLTEHIHTGQNIDLVPPQNIERIEIIKGAASAQYGSDAMGGIVNIITKKSASKAESAVSLSAGSYSTYNTAISLRAPVSDKVSISSFSNYEQSDGVPLLAPAHRVGNMGYTRYTTMNNLSWDINELSDLSCNFYYSQNSMEFRDDNVYGKMFMSSVDYNRALGAKSFITGRMKYSHWESEQSGERNRLLNPEVYAVFNKDGNNIITAGTDFRYMKFTRSAVVEEDQLAFGMFVQDEFEMDRFSFLAALRLDKVEKIKPVITPKLAAMYQLSNTLQLRASLGRGFHAPTVQELYEEGYGHGGRSYRFGNPDLQPEYSFTSTFSIEYSPIKNVELLAHTYYNIITDMITPIYGGIWEENPDTTTVIDKWVRENIHEARIFGVETTVRIRTKHLLLEGGYNYADNKNVSTGGQLPYYPGQSFYAKMMYHRNLTPELRGSVFISLRATKDRSAWNWKPSDPEDYTNPDGLITDLNDYQLLNAGIKLSFREKFDVYINAGNILGQDIQKLDDLLTTLDGEPTWTIGCRLNF